MTAAQTSTETVFHAAPDLDTLGGRISRARDAMSLTVAQLARRLGVKTETVAAWETDRSEPRANRLTMLAGVMGVSPTWLLNGVGEAPQDGQLDSEFHLMEMQLAKLKELHAETGKTVAALEGELRRIAAGFGK